MPPPPAMLSSRRMTYNTSERILWALAPLIGRHGIALDPASNAKSIVPARVKYARTKIAGHRVNGLKASWHKFGPGIVFLNPPYGRALRTWIAKCVREHALGAEIIVVCPARVDAQWWRMALRGGAKPVYWRGRVRFLGTKNSAPFPVALLYFGTRSAALAQVEERAYSRVSASERLARLP